MNKMIITVFNTEEQAFEGLTALKELHNNGDISVYATAVINKNETGEVTVKQVSDKGPIGTSVGIFSGALIGLFAGPAGMIVGATTGMMGGMFYDLDDQDVNLSFLQEVSNALEGGKTAVVSEVDEAWTAPVDIKMEALDAMVFRKLKSEVEEDQFNREMDALDSEMEELAHDLEDANDDMKASIQKQIDKTKAKSLALKNAANKKLTALKEETEAKIEKLNGQLKDADQKRKAKIENRKAKLKADLEVSKQKLEVATREISEYVF